MSKAPLENMIIIEVVREFPTLLWTSKIHYRVHMTQQMNAVMSQLNISNVLKSCFFNINFNIIIPSASRYKSNFFSLRIWE
jgi:hypothetical protein